MPISTISGSRSSHLVSLSISGGSVAEKNSVCRFFGQPLDDAAHLREKAHVEHPVHFIEHEDSGWPEIGVAFLDEIQQPSRRGHEDVHALLQKLALLAVSDAAIDQAHGQIHEARVIAKRGLDLRGQFARGLQHEAAQCRCA